MKHLAIIMDGNRRWARKHSLPVFEGHRYGYEVFKKISLVCLDRGIEQLTVFAFSTENWKRSKKEVSVLLGLLTRALTKELDFFIKHDVRLKIIGDRSGFPKHIQKAIVETEEKTAENKSGQLNLCVNYGGRAEIIEAVKQIVKEGTDLKDINETTFASKIWMSDIPDPEMIIRTSGEKRLSGFLAWSGVYSELMFFDKHWPDFSEEDIDLALKTFEQRQRRFGK